MPTNEGSTLPILSLFKTFTAERRYLQNVAPKTLDWYACSRRAFQPYLADVHSEADLPVQVRRAVMEMAAAGKLSATSINDYSRCMNAFLRWLHTEHHVASAIHIPKLKTQKKVLNLDVDLDNLLIKVQKGKGDKQRIVPCSLQLRRNLYRYIKTYSHPQSEFVFSTAHGTRQTYRNAVRALKVIGGKIDAPEIRFHLMRHTFATAYIRSGGNVVVLRKILGHTSISTTMIYEHLQTDDLKSGHNQHSFLAFSS